MKKLGKILALSSLMITAMMAAPLLTHNDSNNGVNEQALDFGVNGSGLNFVHGQVFGKDGTVEVSKTFVQYGVTTYEGQEIKVLRFATAVKGEIESLSYSRDHIDGLEDKNIDVDAIKRCDRCHEITELHLETSIRSFRADKQCKFVDSLLDNDPANAEVFYKLISEKYPVYLTRNIQDAKRWVKSQVRGSQRCGVLACSSAQRLKPEGIYVPTDIDVKNWFLAPSDDLRSSNMMEVVASEFKVQGLEIDWAVVCWDADLRRANKGKEWDYYNFRGSKWMHRNKEEQQRYLVNSYRVLLTRARQGMVIFVPRGVDPEEDPSRNSAYYDEIYSYLLSCGIKEL